MFSITSKLFVFTAVVSSAMLLNCGGNATETAQDTEIADSTVKLVETVCASCHEFVPPEMLDRKTWVESVLPWMAPKMGIYELDGKPLRSEKEDPLAPAGTYPKVPMVSKEQFRQIMAYFTAKAPEQLPLQNRKKYIGAITTRFKSSFPNLPPSEPALTTFLKILPKEQKIVAGVGGKMNRMGYFNKDLSPVWVAAMPSPPSWVDFSSGSEWMVSCIGSLMPSNKKEGNLVKMLVGSSGNPTTVEVARNLARPVQITRVDMDGNGSPDYLLNSFGHLAGDLAWANNPAQQNKHVLKDAPGAIHSEVVDWDGDGKKDIVTLFAQNREGVYLFKNKGNGVYEETKLVGMPPVYGSSSFAIADMNGDGKKDIIYTAGDNADYSVVLKYYHGVYVYLNEGNNKFKEAYFYPIHGCYRALVKDFDLDGDMDMLTIAFFADFQSQHNEAVVYFENQGNLDFTPMSVPGYEKGRWLTCDADDLDGDGDDDVVLGNFSMGPESFMPPDMAGQFGLEPIFMLLENTTK